MAARCLMVILLCCPTIVVGQVTGRFFLQKDTFAPGEPVFLYFEATNSGTETQNVYRADPYSFCSGYQIRVSTDPPPTSSCAPLGGGGSCFSSYAPLEPGQSRTERILLNYDHKIGADGSYDVQAVQTLSYAPAGQVYFSAAKTSLEVRQQLHFRVDSNATLDDITLEVGSNCYGPQTLLLGERPHGLLQAWLPSRWKIYLWVSPTTQNSENGHRLPSTG
jgi:hypothetical protein